MMNAREASARHTLVGSRIGKFDVISEIGTGGMASVYLARSTGMGGFNRLVAIKVMHPHLSQEDSFVEMFLDEARVAATIQHPNVASIIDVGIEEGLIFLVMDYVEGDSFSNVEKMAVALRRRIPLGITLRVVLDALAGLHCAHELTDHVGQPLRIIHRDVSPQNVMVGVDGVARIVDFGIAKAESRITNTQVGLIKGKLNFMAPEQIRGGALDRRVDVFGMGVTLWEAVTLRRLYAGDNEFETARKILSGEYPSLLDYDAKLPPILDAICHKALHSDPDQRFLTAAAFAECIEQELGAYVAAPREVAGFIAGVASQKLEKERRAVREASQAEDNFEEEDDEPAFISTTMVDMPVRPPPAIDAISGVLPSSAAPRPQQPEEGTARRAPLRAPTMSMPSHHRSPRVGEVGGSTRAMRTQPTPVVAGQSEDYDDDGATSPFHAMAIREQAKALRAIAPSAPAAQSLHDAELEDDLDSTAEARTMFQPASPIAPHGASEDSLRTMPTPRFSHPAPLPQAQPPRPASQLGPAPQPSPPDRSVAIDLVQRRVPYGESTPRPDAPQNDLFGNAPPPAHGPMGSMQGAPGSWHPGNVLGMPPTATQAPPAPQPQAPAGLPAYVYVLASLALLAVAVAVLLYVLRMRA